MSPLVRLAYEISMSVEHPWLRRYPELADAPDIEAVLERLKRILLAQSA